MHEFSKINKDYYLMTIALFFMKVGQFMSLPFLAIYLHHQLSASLIGLVIGIGALTYGLSGVFAGFITNKLGVKKSLVLGLCIGGIALLLFFTIKNILWYVLMSIVFGIGRSIFNVGSRAYGISTYPAEIRRLCFSVRNMMIDAAAAIGPLFGAIFAVRGTTLAFSIVGALYFVIAIFAAFFLKNHGKAKKQVAMHNSVLAIIRDSRLQLMIVIIFIYWLCYSQIDSILPLYLHNELQNGVHVYTAMLIIEAVGCMAFQVLFSYVTRNTGSFKLARNAMILFAIAFGMIALFLSVPILILSSIVLVFAQIIILPLNDYLISKLAPSEHIVTYYGATTLAAIGMGIGPFLGGIIYQHFSAELLFSACSVLCLISIFIYWCLIKRMPIEV